MLKEVDIQVLIKAIDKLHVRLKEDPEKKINSFKYLIPIIEEIKNTREGLTNAKEPRYNFTNSREDKGDGEIKLQHEYGEEYGEI
ncbi:hypothetical protein [Clostridium sp. C8-1-8]|uniref:hypothetical protein n=1 Tax=Clostridium sp. C8-1-8 TaxID=2698831 RepID=UPI0013687374|nr:hypothetical protein [Clostridium sp. C8-1-8]